MKTQEQRMRELMQLGYSHDEAQDMVYFFTHRKARIKNEYDANIALNRWRNATTKRRQS